MRDAEAGAASASVTTWVAEAEHTAAVRPGWLARGPHQIGALDDLAVP